MSISEGDTRLEIPSAIRDKLLSYRRRVWKVKLLEGVLAAAFGLLISFLVVLTLDRFFDTSAWVRGAILLIGSLGVGLWLPLVCHKWIWRRRQLKQVARLLRSKFPRFGDQMLGVIELVESTNESGRSEALTRAALRQVEKESSSKDLTSAIPESESRRWGWAVGVFGGLAVIALLLIPAASTNAFARWMTPWRSIDRYTFTELDKLPTELVVPVAEPSSLIAALAPGSRWSPETAAASVAGVRVDSQRDGRNFDFKLPALKEATTAHLKIGDARRKVKVNPQPRPELQSVSANVHLPDYLQRSEPLNRDIRGGSISIVDGSQLQFEAVATRDLTEATLDGSPLEVEGRTLCTSRLSVEKSRKLEFDWLDSIGLRSKSPLQLRVHVKSDEEPSLVCEGIERQVVLLEQEMLKFNVNAFDDFGVKSIGVEWKGIKSSENPNPTVGEKIVAAGNPEATDLNAVANFSPTREKVGPQTLSMRVFVEDYLPNRERVYSPLYKVYVLTKEEHAVWLTRELSDFYKDALEVYEKESALFQMNKALSGLSQEDLDRPEKRRELESQALAERAQARKLNLLTGVGEKLAREAVRNDEFMVGDLERLANTLKALKGMSKNQLPEIASLLKQASNAAAGKSALSVVDDKSNPGQQVAAAGTNGEKAKQPMPSVGSQESSMDHRKVAGAATGGQKPAASGGGKLGLAGTQLAAVPAAAAPGGT